jgi:hypothetical protein
MPCGIAAQMAPIADGRGSPTPSIRGREHDRLWGGAKSTSPPTTTSTATTNVVTLSGTDSVNNAITASTTFTLTVD